MRSDELQQPGAFVRMIEQVLEDAPTQLTMVPGGTPAAFPDLDIYSFKQTWPDASCGFAGIAAQVLTDAQTVVVSAQSTARAAVYIRGELAYRIERPTEAFWEAIRAQQLPGAAEAHAHLGV